MSVYLQAKEREIKVLKERISRRNSEIGQLRYKLAEAEKTIAAAKHYQERRLELGQDGGLGALLITDILGKYEPRKKTR